MATGAVVTSKQLCLATETNLAIMNTELDPASNRSEYAFQGVRAILDSQDEQMLYSNPANQARPGDASCPERTAYLRYRKPDCDPVGAMAEVTFDCTVGDDTRLEWESVPVTVDEVIGDQFSVSPQSFSCDCDSDPIMELQEKLTRSVRKGLQKYQEILVTKMRAGVGTSFAGVAGTQDLFLYDDNNKPQPKGLFALANEYNKQNPNGIDKPYMLTGADKFLAYQYDANVFKGNVDGFDPATTAFQLGSTYFDRTVQTTLEGIDPLLTNAALTWLKGSVTIAEWFQFESELTQVTPDGRTIFAPMQNDGNILRQKVDVGTPTVGIPFVVDLQIHYDSCKIGGQVTYTWNKSFDLCKIPQGAFCSTYNYCNLWNIGCGTVVC